MTPQSDVPLWVKLDRKIDVRAESAFPTLADTIDYGRHRAAARETEVIGAVAANQGGGAAPISALW